MAAAAPFANNSPPALPTALSRRFVKMTSAIVGISMESAALIAMDAPTLISVFLKSPTETLISPEPGIQKVESEMAAPAACEAEQASVLADFMIGEFWRK